MENKIRILPVADRAVLIDLPDLDSALALFQQLNADSLSGVTELVPAAKTILVSFDTDIVSAGHVSSWCLERYRQILAQQSVVHGSSALSQSELVEIPVQYDGEDLGSVAEYLGITVQELVERHTGTDFIGAFAGFAPGFVYLSNGDPIFTGIPRLETPRTRVPASSVAVAGDFSAIYPKVSPGGWRLLGTTPEQMWNLQRSRPALIQPGFRVRFRNLQASNKIYSLPNQSQVSNQTEAETKARKTDSDKKISQNEYVEIIAAGVQTLIQDYGRPGLTSMGVSASGALDKAAMSMANQLVGNPVSYPVLENALGGLQLRFHCPTMVAVTGAESSVRLTTSSGVRIPASANNSLRVDAGNILKLGGNRAGMRFYVAVRGGFALDSVLGSLATDTLAGVGPEPVRNGDKLPIYTKEQLVQDTSLTKPVLSLSNAKTAHRKLPAPGETAVLNIIPGPRDDWFKKNALQNLVRQKWQVTAQSNRVGLRLHSKNPIKRAINAELPSEGTVSGAIQVPASGQPVLFLADHPLTGGYPVIAVVVSQDIDLLGQIPIGAFIQFQLPDQDRP